MQATQIFYNFLQVAKPTLSKKIKKRGEEIYETYLPLKKEGHKFIYNTQKQTITYLFFQSTFDGYEYGKRMVTKIFDVKVLDNGFKAKERLCS